MQSGRKHLPLFVMSVVLLSVAVADDGAVVTVALPKAEVFKISVKLTRHPANISYKKYLTSINVMYADM
ncbi:hypothetical protein [Thiothrix nivea]|uniref:Uncharacterized protein n=1 Tax=Thiothrix nivea (strain ATCC 35100 / DSM 5205 / JP2) TaxID=870187 RepID=A0A656HIM1_THINJ|nr:hypothetical protein [Thiothrix nivea]EIJ36042.1 hypothetical protein Thini_3534 [Thiothrix nivea DSM 5205]